MSGRGARKAFFLPALLTSLLLAAVLAAPAVAQLPEGEPIYETRRGQGFELYANGSITIGGDVNGSCEALVREARPKPVEPDRELLSWIEACEEAGFSVPGSESFPETGGPSLPIVAALGLALSCSDPCRPSSRSAGRCSQGS